MRRLVPLLLLAACTGDPEVTRPFPDGFLWGAATAGFQVDMGCPTWSDDVCVDSASDWYAWVTDPDVVGDEGLHVSGDPVSAGPGMWELYEDDIARMAADGHTAYRLSIEWSRLFPDAGAASATTVDALAAHADPDAVARYHEILTALRDAGIEPLVTVNHYVLPRWVHDGVACHADLAGCEASGWLDGDRIVPLISLYAGYLGAEFGGHVDRWATLNEPFATTLSGYLLPGEDRSAPPGVSMQGEAVVATIQHQIEGHAGMYDALHAHDTVDASGDGVSADVGIVMNMVAIAPEGDDDAEAVDAMDYLYHRVFLDAITDGAWDDDLDGVADRTRDELADRLDWLGINYYNRVLVSDLGFPILPEVPAARFLPTFDWTPHPEGLAEVVARAEAWGRPIVVTENGTPEVGRSDEVLLDHLGALHEAIEAGADVRGYLYWSWVDNYEWNHGMGMRFGLYALDPDTKARTARPVAVRYREVVAGNGLP